MVTQQSTFFAAVQKLCSNFIHYLLQHTDIKVKQSAAEFDFVALEKLRFILLI